MPPSGFTLVEVLVALAISAITLLSGLKLFQATTEGLRDSRLRSYAFACIDNYIVRIRVQPHLRNLGAQTLDCARDEVNFRIALEISQTAHPNFRRLEARAYLKGSARNQHLAERIAFIPVNF
jgi:general secretion pathway protein I